MPEPAADLLPGRAQKALAGLAVLACAACCLLPALIAAGVVGAGASAIASLLPAVAAALAALAAGVWWFGRRRGGSCSCAATPAGPGGRCGCTPGPAAPTPSESRAFKNRYGRPPARWRRGMRRR